MTKRTPVAKRLGRPPDVDSAATRDRLLEVARAAFAHHGYDSTTNKEIAAAAGITTGAIYHYYPSKADLYLAVYESVQRIVFNAFDSAVVGHTGLIARFGAALDIAVELNRHDPSFAGFLVGVTAESQRRSEIARRIGSAGTTNTGFVTRLVTDAHQSGELADGVDLRALEDLLNLVLSGLAQFSNQTRDVTRHASTVDVLKQFLAGTLLQRAG